MKKTLLVIVAALLGVVSASAQYVSDEAETLAQEPASLAARKGGRIALDGNRLRKDATIALLADVDGENLYPAWHKAKAWRGAGIGMIAGGSTVAVVGAGFVVVYGLAAVLGIAIGASAEAMAGGDGSQAADSISAEIEPYIVGGTAAMFIGAGTAIAGIPVTVVNCRKMTKIVHRYNDSVTETSLPEPSPEVTLSFGPTRSGVGVALNF